MVNSDRLDLNLLRIFNAVMQERSVVKAAKRLKLSQSALSHALTRLRESLGQEIFVRTRNGMKPTAYALQIYEPLQNALKGINDALVIPDQTFHPERIKRSFVIAANDYASAVLLPRLNRILADDAPGIDLVIRPSTRLDLAEQIDLGRIDIAVGTYRAIPERLRSTALMSQHDVLVVPGNHPLASRKVEARDLADFPIVVVSLGGQEDGAVSGFILERGLARQSDMYDRHSLELALEEVGLCPRKKLTIAHFLVIPILLEESDLISIMPFPLAATLARSGKIKIRNLPYEPQLQNLDMVWHCRNHADPAHFWLRSKLSEAAALESKSIQGLHVSSRSKREDRDNLVHELRGA